MRLDDRVATRDGREHRWTIATPGGRRNFRPQTLQEAFEFYEILNLVREDIEAWQFEMREEVRKRLAKVDLELAA